MSDTEFINAWFDVMDGRISENEFEKKTGFSIKENKASVTDPVEKNKIKAEICNGKIKQGKVTKGDIYLFGWTDMYNYSDDSYEVYKKNDGTVYYTFSAYTYSD